ncbi:MAG: hypothetical protein IJI14_11075 [Anaerolineaceae bacterium]|nr:hypothetical protein [Anaerolineaceae bacterium]
MKISKWKITGAASVEEAADILSKYFRQTVIKLDREGCMVRDELGTRIISPLRGIKAVDAT